jgi:hypothetical protein
VSHQLPATQYFFNLLLELDEIMYVNLAWNTKSIHSMTGPRFVVIVAEGIHAGKRQKFSSWFTREPGKRMDV